MVSRGSRPRRWFSEEGGEAYADSCEQDRSSLVKGERDENWAEWESDGAGLG